MSSLLGFCQKKLFGLTIVFSDIGMVATPKNSVTLDMESWVQIQRTSTVDLPIVLER